MNGWDVLTWLSAAFLGGSAVVIFAFFLRDAKGILNRERGATDAGSGERDHSGDGE